MNNGMQYEIHITEHGRDTVSVSLEWTAEAPEPQDEYFFVELFSGEVFLYHFNGAQMLFASRCTTGENAMANRVKRWLGPFPLPPI